MKNNRAFFVIGINVAGALACFLGLLWAKELQLTVARNQVTVAITEEGRNPYLFNPRTLEIQRKLNRVLGFNLTNYKPVEENGFWNSETEKAVESFREMYCQKYNIPRYQAFSAESGDAFGALGAEDPNSTPYNNRDDQPYTVTESYTFYCTNTNKLNDGVTILTGLKYTVNPRFYITAYSSFFMGLGIIPTITPAAGSEISWSMSEGVKTSGDLGARYKGGVYNMMASAFWAMPLVSSAINSTMEWFWNNQTMTEALNRNYQYGGSAYFNKYYQDKNNRVTIQNGNYSRVENDFTLSAGGMSLDVTRYYSAQNENTGLFGKGWNIGDDYKVLLSVQTTNLIVIDGSGFGAEFIPDTTTTKNYDGTYLQWRTTNTQAVSLYSRVELKPYYYGKTGSKITIVKRNGEILIFDLISYNDVNSSDKLSTYRLSSIVNRYGFKKIYSYDWYAKLLKVELYNPANLIIGSLIYSYAINNLDKSKAKESVPPDSVTVKIGNEAHRINYSYNLNLNTLTNVQYPDGRTVNYQYQEQKFVDVYNHITKYLGDNIYNPDLKTQNTGIYPQADIDLIASYFQKDEITNNLRDMLSNETMVTNIVDDYLKKISNELYQQVINITLNTRNTIDIMFGWKPGYGFALYSEASVKFDQIGFIMKDGEYYNPAQTRFYLEGNLLDNTRTSRSITASGLNGRLHENQVANIEGWNSGNYFASQLITYYRNNNIDYQINKYFTPLFITKGVESFIKPAAIPVMLLIADYNSQINMLDVFMAGIVSGTPEIRIGMINPDYA